MDELGIAQIMHARRGIEPHLPQAPEHAFFCLAVPVGVYPRFGNRCFCLPDKVFAPPFVPFGAFEDIFAPFRVYNSSFYSWHKASKKW